MKVLHVIDSAQRRGAEVFASDLIQSLNEAGIEQRVAILESEPREIGYQAPVAFLPRNGLTVPGLRMSFRTLRGLRALIAGWKPDIVQSHGGDSLKYSVLAAMGSNGRVVYRGIGMTPPWIQRGLRRRAYSWLIHQTDHVIALAEAIRQEIVDLFRVPANRTVMIPNAVDARRMEPVVGREGARQALGIPLEARVMLSIAALTWEKDPLAHVDVSRQVLREVPDTIHLFVGDGPMRGQLEARIRDLDLSDCVKLLGVRSDIADIFCASDVLLFASRIEGMEGMPTILIEAGMASLPVVGYAIAGVSEVVVDGVTGLLVAPGLTDDLALNISALFSDEERRRRMGKAARHRCLEMFDIRAVAPRYQALYEKLLTAS